MTNDEHAIRNKTICGVQCPSHWVQCPNLPLVLSPGYCMRVRCPPWMHSYFLPLPFGFSLHFPPMPLNFSSFYLTKIRFFPFFPFFPRFGLSRQPAVLQLERAGGLAGWPKTRKKREKRKKPYFCKVKRGKIQGQGRKNEEKSKREGRKKAKLQALPTLDAFLFSSPAF